MPTVRTDPMVGFTGQLAVLAALAATAELGPACADCATRCYHGCGEVATRLVLCADEDGHETESRALCERCGEEEPERAARIRRAAWREDDGRGDWMRACQRDVEVA